MDRSRYKRGRVSWAGRRLLWRCLVWGGLALWGGLLAGCFDPYGVLQRESIQLLVNGLGEDTHFLRVELAVCEGQQIVGGAQRVFEHAVALPFGNESFFLPATLEGKTVDLVLLGYRSRARRELVQHRRQRLVLRSKKGVLPAMTLQRGPLTAGHRLCHLPQKPPDAPPVDRVPPVVVVGGNGASQTGPVSGVRLPGVPHDKALPSLPSLSALNDELQVRSSLFSFRFTPPIRQMVAQGQWVAVLDATHNVHVVHATTGDKAVEPYSVKPDGCQPTALAIQGDVLAVVCAGNDYGRLFLFSLDTRSREYSKSQDNQTLRFYGPPEGFDVGVGPVAVRITGSFVVVLDRGHPPRSSGEPKKAQLHVIRMDQLAQRGQVLDISTTDGIVEWASDLAVVGRDIFVADRQGAIALHPYRINAQGVVERVQSAVEVTGPVGRVVANGRYLVTLAEASSPRSLTVVRREAADRPGRLTLDSDITDLVLLSHTLVTLHAQPPSLSLRDLRTGTSRRVALPRAYHTMAVAGDTLLLGSQVSGLVQPVTVTTRRDSLHYQVGAQPGRIFLVGNQAWVFDPVARRIRQLADLRPSTPQTSAQPYVVQSFPLAKADPHGWMGVYKGFLLYAGSDNALYARTLPPRLEHAPLQVEAFVWPVRTARIVGNTLYVLLGSPSSAPVLAEIALNPNATTRKELLQGKPRVRSFPNAFRNWRPIDIFPWTSSVFVVADRSQRLFRVDATRLVQIGEPIVLSGEPIRLTPLRAQKQLAVAHKLPNSGGQVVMIDMDTFTPRATIPTYADSDLSAMDLYGGFLLIADRYNDIVMVCDPDEATPCLPLRVGCGPASFAVLGTDKDNARLLTTNACDDSLSLVTFSLPSVAP